MEVSPTGEMEARPYMSTKSNQHSAVDTSQSDFEPVRLVSKKPSSVPDIYAHIVKNAPTTPKDIQRKLNVSKSVTFSALDKLLDLGLIERPTYGEYEPTDIVLDPDTVRNLGQIRSKKQFEICRFSVGVDSFDVADLTTEFGGTRSMSRKTAVQLCDNRFLQQEWEVFAKSPKAYQLTEQALRALSTIEVGNYLGQEGRQVSSYTNGVVGTAFRTAYEIEDAHYMRRSDRDWIRPDEIASSLDKNRKKTLSRLADMDERGLLASKALREKMVFMTTEKTESLIRDLRLFTISKLLELDFYSIAKQTKANEASTPDDLYSSLIAKGCTLTPQVLNSAIDDLKRAEIIEGNSMSGYRFLIS